MNFGGIFQLDVIKEAELLCIEVMLDAFKTLNA